MIRILIADDDREDVEIFRKALQNAEMETKLDVVSDGGALLEYLCNLDNPKPNYLFLDLAMPKRSGFECLNIVRRNSAYDDIRLIILSDSINLTEIDDAYEQGANYFLTKPVSLKEFSEMLVQIFSTAAERASCRAEFVLMKNVPGNEYYSTA